MLAVVIYRNDYKWLVYGCIVDIMDYDIIHSSSSYVDEFPSSTGKYEKDPRAIVIVVEPMSFTQVPCH